MKSNIKIMLIILFMIITIGFVLIESVISFFYESFENVSGNFFSNKEMKILATDEARTMCEILEDNGFCLDVTYAGSLEMIDMLNEGQEFDAVFLSNSIWMSKLDTKVNTITDYSTISINPIVFGVKKSKAEELGLIKEDLMLQDIVNVISEGKLNFTMPSGTQTNTGASSLLGFTSTLCGNPEVLTSEDIKNENLLTEMTALFSGVNKNSGSESFVEQLYLTNKYDAAILYETSVININKQIENEEDIIYALYPCDGVSVSDLIFGYTGNTNNEYKKTLFDEMKNILLSEKVQKELLNKGHRVWYGGINENVDKTVFNPEWGIDTTKYITPIKYPALTVMNEIFNIYQMELRKPSHTVFVLDYSGSMYGDGYEQLVDAMEYILDTEKASKDYIQFSDKDIVTIIPFSTEVIATYSTLDGNDFDDLLKEIKDTDVTGGTNIYDSVTEAFDVLSNIDISKYNATVVVMTDGVGNGGSEKEMQRKYNLMHKDIPVYSILFGDASEEEMQEIADYTGGKVFDGKENLKYAFKQVRGYN